MLTSAAYVVLVLACSAAGDDLNELIKSYTENSTEPLPDSINLDPVSENADNYCVCVPFYQCKSSDGTLNVGGEGIINVRKTIECKDLVEVCCNRTEVIQKPEVPKPTAEQEKPAGCGYRNERGIGFNLIPSKENEAQYGEFPWMAAVIVRSPAGEPGKVKESYQCGGALIHPQVVLTAAHCVLETKAYAVRLGEWDTKSTQNILPRQNRLVDLVVIHENFYKPALYNDVALLFLKEPAEPAANVQFLCLPDQDESVEHPQCFSSGWGKDQFGKEGRYQSVLKKVELPTVRRSQCVDALRKSRLGKFFELHRSFVCAGGAGKDTCKGDGGSPLVCPVPGAPGRYQAAGLVAWGIGCNMPNTPAAYVNVAMFRSWIDDQLAYKNLETKYYSKTFKS